MDNNKIGKFISSLRKDKGLTQQELGERLYVTDKAVSKWERGLSLPDITILESLAKELDVEISEILHGEKGNKETIDIQDEIDKILEEISIENNKRRKKLTKVILIVFFIVSSIFILIKVNKYIYYRKYNPKVIVEGENKFIFGKYGKYFLENEGLEGIIDIISKSKNMNDKNYNISSFKFNLNIDGSIKDFTIYLKVFDEEFNYIGNASYSYEGEKLIHEYNNSIDCDSDSYCEMQKVINNEYVKSFSLGNISEKLKQIPFKEQIKKSNLQSYTVEINTNGKIFNNEAVFDMRDGKRVEPLSYSDYLAHNGGSVSDGVYIIISLSGTSYSNENRSYKYIFEYLYGDTKNIGYCMKTDYIIQNGFLKFTRDFGVRWIDTDIDEDTLIETLKFYGDVNLLSSSWFISTNDLLPIAYFYGGDKNTNLKISNDNGLTWNDYAFKLMKPITKRIVGFTSQNNGFVGIGTDWTMGSGEEKKIYLTENRGKDWKEIPVPENDSWNTLLDLFMYNKREGIILLNDPNNNRLPIIYSTLDGGKKWNKVELDESDLPNEMTYMIDISNIIRKDNLYYITMGQGNYTPLKFIFKSKDLNTWEFYKFEYDSVES